MSDKVISAIDSSAQGPKKASDGAGSLEQHPLKDQIEAAKFLAAQDAVKKSKRLGIRFSKLVPPGTQ